MALHCPHCMAVILSRRNQLCSACHNPLPTEILLTPDELAAIEGAEKDREQGRKRREQQHVGDSEKTATFGEGDDFFSRFLTRVAASKRMRRDIPSPIGLKPTLRHMMIVILWSALLLTVLRMMLGWGFFGAPPEVVCISVASLVATCPVILLCVLLLSLDRRGPVRVWYFSCCWAGGGFLAGASYLLVDLVCLALSGRPTVTFPLFPITALVCLLGSTMHLRTIWPRRCECCGRRAVIATGRAVRRGPLEWRNKVEGWCAICGQAYEREGLRDWLPKAERVDGLPSTNV
jgi:hypothetical protein